MAPYIVPQARPRESARTAPWRERQGSPDSSDFSSPSSTRSSSPSTISSSPPRWAIDSWRQPRNQAPIQAPAPAPAPAPSRKGLPSYDAIKLGMVVYLSDCPPPDSSIIWDKLARESTQRPWNHPAVIVGKGEGCVFIRLCTSFGGRSLETARIRKFWELYLAADEHAAGKKTWVNLSPNSRYPIEYHHLRPVEGASEKIKFSQKSIDRIVGAPSDD